MKDLLNLVDFYLNIKGSAKHLTHILSFLNNEFLQVNQQSPLVKIIFEQSRPIKSDIGLFLSKAALIIRYVAVISKFLL